MKKMITLLLAVCFATAASAQILSPERLKNRAKQRASQRAEQKVNEKVDSGVDRIIDGLFGAVEKGVKDVTTTEKKEETKTPENNSKTEEDASELLAGLFGGINKSAPPAESYEFHSSFSMKISSTDKDGLKDLVYKYYFPQTGNYLAGKIISTSDPEMQKQMQSMEAILFDFDLQSMYTFMSMNGQKQMISMAIPESAGEKLEETYEKTTYTKTGNTKTIIGYTCDGYTMEQDGETYMIWVSRNAVGGMSRYYELFNKMANSPNSNAMAYNVNPELKAMIENGQLMMGMDMKNKNGVETSMEMVEMKSNDTYTFSTAGYANMMDFNAIMKQAQQQENNTDNNK